MLIQRNIQITFLSEDVDFANRIQQVLSEHLFKPEFNTQMFCEITGMSRSQLHRKIKSSTGLSTSAFIRKQRIKAAAELLQSTNVNINHISAGVGFKSTSYFNKHFKEIMGCSPTEYIHKQLIQTTPLHPNY
jgi:AraC-like DNA-binding protein